ncbi:MAG: hypothetical protein L0206_10470, partial [Actinobacteria bacterium]|nr:hypothetical protein [Actinomycetota bacterium]
MIRAARLGLLLSLALASAASAADILLLRDGSRRIGTLQACTQAQCRFDGTTIARPVIYRIGLST